MTDNRPDDVSTFLKLKLIACIKRNVVQKGWTQTQAAEELGISRSRFCRLMGGHTEGTSEGRLIKCLTDLGNDIHILVTSTQTKPGHIEVNDSCNR